MTVEGGVGEVLWTQGSECRGALRHEHLQVLVKRKASQCGSGAVPKGRRGHGEKQGWRQVYNGWRTGFCLLHSGGCQKALGRRHTV